MRCSTILTPSQRPNTRECLVQAILLRCRHVPSHPIRRRAGAKAEQRARRLDSFGMLTLRFCLTTAADCISSSKPLYAHAHNASSTPHAAKKILNCPDHYPAISSSSTHPSRRPPSAASQQQTYPTSSAYLVSLSAPAPSPQRPPAFTSSAEIVTTSNTSP
jgi:hypothetical protein